MKNRNKDRELGNELQAFDKLFYQITFKIYLYA